MARWVWLAILTCVLGGPAYAADRGDPIFHTDTDELDIPSLKVGGVPVSTEAGTSGSYAPALLATTENITLSGEQTIDGVLTSADAIVVWMQTNAAQNGIYVSGGGAWARRSDMDVSGEFAGHQSVYVQAGTRFAGTTFRVANVSAVTVGTTAIVLAPDAPQWHVKALQTIIEGGSADCTPPPGQVIGTMLPIVGDGGPITLGNPQIVAGTRINQLCLFLGTNGANTVAMGDGSGVQLAQSEVPLLFDDRLTALMRWDGTVWRQVDQAGVATGAGIGTLQQAYQSGDVGGFTSLPQSRPYVKAPSGDLGPRELIHDGGGSGDYIVERLVGVNTPGGLPETLIQPDDAWTIRALLGDPLSEVMIGQIRNVGGLSIEFEGLFDDTANHIETAIGAHAASAISFDPTGGSQTTTQLALDGVITGLTDHLADPTGAHAASAIAFTPTGTIAAATVQAAIAEVASEGGTASRSNVFMSQASPNNAAVTYLPLSSSNSASTVINQSSIIAVAGVVDQLTCQVPTGPTGGDSWALRLRQNGADVNITCTITSGTAVCEDTSNTDTFARGDRAEYSLTPSGSPTVPASIKCSVRFTPS